MNWMRARSDEQIEQRAGEILAAAARLYRENRFDEISLSMIAEEARFTRSNVYRYFDSKEDIFLELLQQDIAAWRQDIAKTFDGWSGGSREFAEKWVHTLLKHRRLLQLFTILYTLLEPNATPEALTQFKQASAREIAQAAGLLADLLPFSTEEEAVEFVFAQSWLAIGAYPMLALTPKQEDAMQIAGLSTDPGTYRNMLVHSVERLLPRAIAAER